MIPLEELSQQKCNNNFVNKTSELLHSNTMESGHSITRSEGSLAERIYSIPRIIWKSPPRFNLNEDWEVAAGGESRESEHQKERESAVPEAVYPRNTSIPSSPPSLPAARRPGHHQEAPLIPVVPVEETTAILIQASSKKALPSPTPLPPMEADVPAAASVVLTAILKSSEQGSLIDTNLLIKILNDPKLLENLTSDEVTPPFLKRGVVDSPKSTNTSDSPSSSPHFRTSDTPLKGSHPRYPVPSEPGETLLPELFPFPRPRRVNQRDGAAKRSGGGFWSGNASVGSLAGEEESGKFGAGFWEACGEKGGDCYYKSLVSLHGGERGREKKENQQQQLMFDDVYKTEEVKGSGVYLHTPPPPVVGNGDLSCFPFETEIHMPKRWRRSY